MKQETELQIVHEVEKLMSYLLYRIREISGEFPCKMRVTTFYPPNENRATFHFMETEKVMPPDDIQKYEEAFQNFEKQNLVDIASDILLKGKDEL